MNRSARSMQCPSRPAPLAARIHHELGITAIFVTHDQEGARSIADRVIILKDGKIVQGGNARTGLPRSAIGLRDGIPR